MNINDINALLDGTATIETKIDILPLQDEGILTLTDNNSILSWDYNDIRYVEDKGFIGMFVERTLEGSLDNINETFNIENREIILYLGVRRYVENNAELVTEIFETLTTEDSIVLGTDQRFGDYITTFYSLGNFIVDKPDSDEVVDNTKFTAKDYTIKFNKPFDADYVDDIFTKSFNQMLNDGDVVTASILAQYTCEQAGVELGSILFTNSDFVIDSNQFQNGEVCRDVMKYIGKLAYSWVRIDWDNKVYIDFAVKDTVDEEYSNITKDNYYSLEVQKEKYGVINKVVVSSSVLEGDFASVEDEDSISQNGENVLAIYDNPILYTQELKNLAIEKGNVLFGLEYTPLTTTTTGHPWLKGNELISIIDKNENVLYTYPFDRTIHYTGHITTDISSYALTKVEEDYSYKGVEAPTTQRKQTKAVLDRANQILNVVIENIDGQNEKITELSASLDGINTRVSNTYTEISEKLNNYATTESVKTVSNSVETLQTSLNAQIKVTEEIIENGVSKVSNTTGTFDDDGLHIEKTGAETKSTLNEIGVSVVDAVGSSDQDLLFAGYVNQNKADANSNLTSFVGQTVVYTNNLIVGNYLVMGSHSRFEDYQDGTGIFDL